MVEGSEIIKYSILGNNEETFVEVYQKALMLLCYKGKFLFKDPVKFYISYKDTIRSLYVKIRKLIRIHQNITPLESEIRI